MAESLRLNFPGASYVGPGTIRSLGGEASRLGTRALLVTGRRSLREAGTTQMLVSMLEEAGLEVVLFEEAPPEPDVATVDRAREQTADRECDLVVEAGGGSALDVGKAAAALANEEAPTADYQQSRDIARPGLPHIAIATTAGTGAEATRNSVLTDPERHIKQSIRGDGLMPNISFTDPDLTLSCPPEVTAAAGMDALVQAIESLFSVHAIATTKALSLVAAQLIARYLPVAYEDGSDRTARHALAEGSYMAGLALGSARLGGVHGMAHPVGLCYGLPHGIVCAVLIGPVLQSHVVSVPAKYMQLRDTLGSDPIRLLSTLRQELGLPSTLGPYPEPDWEERIIDYAVRSGSSKANPTPVDEHYVRSILQLVCQG
jgi:alcohol dehydrogenase class IV